MPVPALFPAFAVVGGVALGVHLPALHRAAALCLIAAVLAAVWTWRARWERTSIALAGLGFVAAGLVLGAAHISSASQTSLRQFFDQTRAARTGALDPVVVEGTLRTDATPTEYGASMIVDVARVQTPCGWLPAEGGLRLAVNGSLAASRLGEWRGGRRVRLPVLLRLPTTYRVPGVSDGEFGLARRGIALGGSTKSAALVEVVARGHGLAEAAAAIRAYTRRTIAAALPGRPVAAAVVTAILIGDRGGLDPMLERRLQEAGTYHVIAISGGNVAILAGLAFVVLRLLGVPRRSGSLVLAALLCAYGYVAGGGPSVARATIAAATYLIATAADHRTPALNVLATVALVAVVYEPLGVFDPGLLLSYGATLALLIGAGRMLRLRVGHGGERPGRVRSLAVLQHLRSGALAILAGTVCAELAIFPIVASVFHRVTFAGLVLNFAAIPLMTVAQVGGLAVLTLSPLSPTLGQLAGWVAASAADGLTSSPVFVEFAPWLTWRVPAAPIAIVAMYYAGWCVALLPRMPRTLRATALALSAFAAVLVLVPALTDRPAHRLPGKDELRVTFLDVGQGDSILVQFPGGASLLVDAAGLPASSFDLADRVLVPALLALGVRRLDYLAITHGDPDHVVGAPGVARDFRPREIWEGAPVPPHDGLRTLRAIVTARRGAARLARPDDRLQIGRVELRVLHPPEPDWERQRVRNDDSIVMELRYGDVSIVLTGDIGAAIEESLISKLSDAPLRVLKASHHGSATSSSEAWLSAARAAALVISCGRDNRYGHPAAPVLQRAVAHGLEIFRTDQDGTVTVSTDGRTATVKTFAGRMSRITTKITKATKVTKESSQ